MASELLLYNAIELYSAGTLNPMKVYTYLICKLFNYGLESLDLCTQVLAGF